MLYIVLYYIQSIQLLIQQRSNIIKEYNIMALTTQQIHETADELQEKGVNPTLSAVRQALGGGSFTTISDAMKTWRQDNQDEQQLQKVEIPSSINERLQGLGADMWQTAINIANERLAAEREALVVAQTKAQAQTDQAQEAVKTLEAEYAALLIQLDVHIAGLEQATADAAQSSTALEMATAQHVIDVDAIKQQLSDTQHKLELEQERSSTAYTAANELRLKIDDVSAQLTQSRENIATANAQSKAQQADIERLKAEIAESKALNTQKDAKIEQITNERNDIKTTAAELKGELKAVTAELNKEKTENDSLMVANEKLIKANATLEAENKALSQKVLDKEAQIKGDAE